MQLYTGQRPFQNLLPVNTIIASLSIKMLDELHMTYS